MATPFFDLIEELRTLGGSPKVTYPRGDNAFPVTERTIKAKRGTHILALGTAEPDATRFPNNKLTEQIELRADAQIVEVYRKYEVLPGKLLTSKKTTDWGPATVTNQPNPAGTAPTITSSTESAQATAKSGVESDIDISTYDAMPGPWIFGYQLDPDTNIGVRVQKRLNVNGTQGSITTPPAVAITAATVANPTVLTIAAGITIKNGELVTIAGDSNATPTINNQWPATVIDATHISIPVNVTAVAGSGFGTVRLAALIYQEIDELNDRQCIEMWSQVDTSTLVNASKTWSDYIDYPWKEVLVGIDAFTDSGVGSTSNAGGFPSPTTVTWHFSQNTDVQVGIRTSRYTGKTFATVTRSYSIGAPTPDAVLQIRTSSGEIVMEGTSAEQHYALSQSGSIVGLQTSLSSAVHFKTARIEDVLTNGFVTGGTIGPDITLKMDGSSPSTFTAGTTFIASCDVSPGRLGLYSKETVVVTVPTPFPT